MAKQPKKAFSFAHLLSRAGIRADGDQDGDNDQNDERKQRDDESDEDYAKRMEELDNKGDDGQDDAGADDGGDDDPDASDEESDKEKAARAKERARCAAIFGAKAAANRPDFAAHLAFNTSMSAADAIGMLGAFAADGAQASTRTSLAIRMNKVSEQNVGASAAAAQTGPKGAAAMILAAGKKRRGEA